MLVVVAGSLVWNARRLETVEAAIADRAAEIERLSREKVRLTETLRSLRDAPDAGVRALAQPVENVAGPMYDFTLWVDVAHLSKKVEEVVYEFAGSGYEPLSSTLADNGFAAYFRGPVRPGQPVCPGRTRVTITFEDASRKQIDYDLCAVAGIAAP